MKRNTIPLKIKLLKYLQDNPGWHKKVSLYLISEEYGYSPESGARRLRELADEGQIKAGYYTGKFAKNLTKYTADQVPVTESVKIVEVDGRRIAIIQ